MNDLLNTLTQGEHVIKASVRPENTIEGFKAAIDRQYVHIRFTGTRGGTEIGFSLNHQLSDLSNADFEAQTGTIRLCGDLTLDYEKVRCVAQLDLATLVGTGHLELLA